MVWSGRCRVFREGRREDLAGVVYFRMLWVLESHHLTLSLTALHGMLLN